MASFDPERWWPIEGFPMYEVSDLGRVRSWQRMGRRRERSEKPRLLKPHPGNHGYLTVGLRRLGSPRAHTKPIHGLVARAFIGPCPPGKEAAHENGVRTDNRADNLRWKARKENVADAIRHGTFRFVPSKLAPGDVREIRRRRDAGEKLAPIAVDYGVSIATVSEIGNRRTWERVA